ncbi:MAG: DUF3800 domain-containing protein [Thermodesulfobacteriota bacterium]
MSYLLFIDESGIDERESPYYVLCGVCIQDRDIWNLIRALQDAELSHFGLRLSKGSAELKGKKLLKKKVFKHAGQMDPIAPDERCVSAKTILEKKNDNCTRKELSALAQAKIAFAKTVYELLSNHHATIFASIVPNDAPKQAGDFLRKDYSYLFERFFYFLEDRGPEYGFVVFDELEKSRCHLLMEQMRGYFLETATGRLRAGRIIPEPFFVHSELTTLVQLADLSAYIINWGLRLPSMDLPARQELEELAVMVRSLEARSVRNGRTIYGMKVIEDLRPRVEKA